ncbi:MAG: M81 family metallopeptidase [Proteobacteria bacterium]|nr:M81 family metallopeptidase [Pseudomonadota bacterium]MBI3498040.1 M81 family metallopeptidase [Pseudomonadota bacterium]
MARIKPPRIAVGGLLFEGNTLSPVVSDMADFENKYLERGAGLAKLMSSNTEVGGALHLFGLYEAEVLPLIATHGGAGGRVARSCYERLKGELIDRLRASLPVDGVYLALHGAFVAEGLDDAEGDILADVRLVVGEGVPVAVSLDLHAHVTPAMLRLSQILIGYQHYPHDDGFETGRRAAGLLLRTIQGKIKPVMRARRAPMLLPAQKQRTKGTGPMADAHAVARARETAGEVLAASYFCVQPWLDFPGVGFTAVAISDGDGEAADRVALDMAKTAWSRRQEFAVPTIGTAEAIRRGRAANAGPIVLADAADCVGGGAAGDSAVVLEALIQAGSDQSAAILLVDPETVGQATKAGVGGRFRARIGNKLDPVYGKPVEAEVTVERLFDGRFTYSGGLMGGLNASMGPSAVLEIGEIKIICASASAYEYADEQFRAAGIDPHELKFIVVKNPMNYQQAYAYALAMLVVDTPGPTTPNLAGIPWKRMDRPRWPIDDGFEPVFEPV